MIKKLMFVICVVALSFQMQAQQVTNENMEGMTVAISAANSFGFKFMRAVTELQMSTGEIKNTMTSPISMTTAFAMALNGAAGDSARNIIADQFGLDPNLDREVINDSIKQLSDHLIQLRGEEEYEQKYPEFKIVNNAWHTTEINSVTGFPKFQYSEDFTQSLTRFFDVRFSLENPTNGIDFKDAQSADLINTWANDNTNGLVPKIIDADTLSELAWILINAVYFEGTWTEELLEVNEDLGFKDIQGNAVPTKHLRSDIQVFPYYGTDSFQIVEIPISNKWQANSQYSVLMLVPRETSDFLEMLSSKNSNTGVWEEVFWNEIRTKMEYSGGQVSLPEFAFSYDVDMKKEATLTQEMGMLPLFITREADFSLMGTPDSESTKIGLVRHSTRIELDKKGLKAAAVTMIGGILSAIMIPELKWEVRADNPFFYAIVEKNTNSYLFLGMVVSPEAKE